MRACVRARVCVCVCVHACVRVCEYMTSLLVECCWLVNINKNCNFKVVQMPYGMLNGLLVAFVR